MNPVQSTDSNPPWQRLNLPEANVFFNYLPTSFNQQTLESICRPFGTVLHAKVVTHNQVSLGYGFVQFSHPDEANACITALNKTPIENKVITLRIARPSTSGLSRANVHLTHLPMNWSELDVITFCQRFGQVIEVRMLYSHPDHDGNRVSRGIAFCRYNSNSEAMYAVEQIQGFIPNPDDLTPTQQLKSFNSSSDGKTIDNNNINEQEGTMNQSQSPGLITTTFPSPTAPHSLTPTQPPPTTETMTASTTQTPKPTTASGPLDLLSPTTTSLSSSLSQSASRIPSLSTAVNSLPVLQTLLARGPGVEKVLVPELPPDTPIYPIQAKIADSRSMNKNTEWELDQMGRSMIPHGPNGATNSKNLSQMPHHSNITNARQNHNTTDPHSHDQSMNTIHGGYDKSSDRPQRNGSNNNRPHQKNRNTNRKAGNVNSHAKVVGMPNRGSNNINDGNGNDYSFNSTQDGPNNCQDEQASSPKLGQIHPQRYANIYQENNRQPSADTGHITYNYNPSTRSGMPQRQNTRDRNKSDSHTLSRGQNRVRPTATIDNRVKGCDNGSNPSIMGQLYDPPIHNQGNRTFNRDLQNVSNKRVAGQSQKGKIHENPSFPNDQYRSIHRQTNINGGTTINNKSDRHSHTLSSPGSSTTSSIPSTQLVATTNSHHATAGYNYDDSRYSGSGIHTLNIGPIGLDPQQHQQHQHQQHQHQQPPLIHTNLTFQQYHPLQLQSQPHVPHHHRLSEPFVNFSQGPLNIPPSPTMVVRSFHNTPPGATSGQIDITSHHHHHQQQHQQRFQPQTDHNTLYPSSTSQVGSQFAIVSGQTPHHHNYHNYHHSHQQHVPGMNNFNNKFGATFHGPNPPNLLPQPGHPVVSQAVYSPMVNTSQTTDHITADYHHYQPRNGLQHGPAVLHDHLASMNNHHHHQYQHQSQQNSPQQDQQQICLQQQQSSPQPGGSTKSNNTSFP